MAVTLGENSGTQYATELVTKILRATPDKPPQFFLNVREESLAQIKAAVIREAGGDSVKRDKWLQALTKVDGPSASWPQDYMQSYVGSDGRPRPRELTFYRTKDRYYDEMGKSFQKQCGIASGEPITPEDYMPKNGYGGGNIEGGPNGICIVGQDGLARIDHEDYMSKTCGGGTTVSAPTKFLAVGHTDEITSTLRTGQGECDFVVLIASPQAALDAMKADPSGKAFEILESKDGDRLAREGVLNDICKQFLSQPPVPENSERSRTTSQGHGGLKFFPFAQAFAQTSGRSSEETPFAHLEKCKDMTNGQFISLYQSNHTLQAVNRSASEQLGKFKKDLDGAWRRTAPQCPRRFVEMPTLFSGYSFMGGRAEDGKSVLPNVNNVQQFGKTVLMPDPQSETMRKAIKERMKITGLEVDFINTNSSQIRGGNLHCTTNALRYCRPRQTPGSK